MSGDKRDLHAIKVHKGDEELALNFLQQQLGATINTVLDYGQQYTQVTVIYRCNDWREYDKDVIDKKFL